MDILQGIEKRHSVRVYKDEPIAEDVRQKLNTFVEDCVKDSGLTIKVVYDDPEIFDSRLAHYGNFKNANNLIILAGDKNNDNDEKCGYYGEKIVLYAQTLGLNTCWAALTFSRGKVRKMLDEGDRLCVVIAFGYGENDGAERKSKSIEEVVASKGDMPDWFKKGVEAALLAPTAVNQQKFKFGIKDGEPVAVVSGRGPCVKVDLGIAKYHFEVASGRKVINSVKKD